MNAGGRAYRFDSFACALRALAPRCPSCDDFSLLPASAGTQCERCDQELVFPTRQSDGLRSQFAYVGEVPWESLGLTFGPSAQSAQAG